MSAYLTSNDTISALVTYWDKSCSHGTYNTPKSQLVRAHAAASDRNGNGWDHYQADQDTCRLIGCYDTPAKAVFALLVAENVLSLQARYPDSPDMWSAATLYRFKPSATVHNWLHCAPLGHGNLVGMASGYGYQACEHDGWKCSIAYQLIDQIKSNLLQDLARRDCGSENHWADFEEPAAATSAPKLISLAELARG